MGMGMLLSIHYPLEQWCHVAGLRGTGHLWNEYSWGSAAFPIFRRHPLSFGALLLVLLLQQNTQQKQLKEGRAHFGPQFESIIHDDAEGTATGT